jgi:hypothetical protein
MKKSVESVNKKVVKKKVVKKKVVKKKVVKKEFGSSLMGEKVIVRTYSAGVWFGELSEKSEREVILINARRMYRWKCNRSISLSGVAVHGIDARNSKTCPAVERVWLEAIEIIPLGEVAIKSLEDAPNVEAE